jgi:hypothetical protein
MNEEMMVCRRKDWLRGSKDGVGVELLNRDIVLRKGGGAESEMRRSAVLAAGGFSHQNT